MCNIAGLSAKKAARGEYFCNVQSAFEWLLGRRSISDFLFAAPPLRPCTSYNKVVVPRLGEEQHPPLWIQPSAPYTNAAPVNNNNQQWTSFLAGFNIGSTGHSNTSSFGPYPMPGVILNGGHPCPTGLKQVFLGQPSEWIEASVRFANSEPVKKNAAVD
ncbi:hypothetical protein V6N13_020228 [Hibiscus sabdariffa]